MVQFHIGLNFIIPVDEVRGLVHTICYSECGSIVYYSAVQFHVCLNYCFVDEDRGLLHIQYVMVNAALEFHLLV